MNSKTQDARRVEIACDFGIMEARSEDVLKSAVTAVGDATYRWSIDDDSLSWSPGAELLLGVPDISKLATHRDFAARMVT